VAPPANAPTKIDVPPVPPRFGPANGPGQAPQGMDQKDDQ